MVFAAIISVVESTSLSANLNLSDNAESTINFTIYNESATIGEMGNLTEINVTLPGGLLFVAGTNRSGNLSANDINFTNSTNLLTFRNKSGIMTNDTNNSAFSFNVTKGSPGVYNISVTLVNISGNYRQINISLLINDTVAPNVTFLAGFRNFSNHSGTINFNMSIADNQGDNDSALGGRDGKGVSFVNFTIFRAENRSYFNQTNLTNVSGGYWNRSFDTTTYTDGLYNITVTVNDTNGNINTTNIYHVRFDNTAPEGTHTCTPNPANNGDVVTCSCSPSDGGSGVNGDQTSFTANPSTSANGDTVLTCTFEDNAGNEGSKDFTLTVQTPGGSGSGGGGSSGSSAFSYIKTIALDNKQLEDSGVINQMLKLGERIRLRIGEGIHHVGIRELSTTSATVEISSDTVRVSLDVGEDAKVDVDHDKFYDVYVKLNSITNGNADLSINYLHEEIPGVERGEGVETTGEIVAEEDLDAPMDDKKGVPVWVWILVVVIIIILGGWLYKRRA
tara:strand:+ start:2027 stop:3541 length:1515 start_codon:yes stop_codon:yes gene_type:complete